MLAIADVCLLLMSLVAVGDTTEGLPHLTKQVGPLLLRKAVVRHLAPIVDTQGINPSVMNEYVPSLRRRWFCVGSVKLGRSAAVLILRAGERSVVAGKFRLVEGLCALGITDGVAHMRLGDVENAQDAAGLGD